MALAGKKKKQSIHRVPECPKFVLTMNQALMGYGDQASFAEFPNLICLHLICRNVPVSKREIVARTV